MQPENSRNTLLLFHPDTAITMLMVSASWDIISTHKVCHGEAQVPHSIHV